MLAEKANFSVGLMCRALGLSRSGFYAWLSRQRPSKKELEDAKVVEAIREVHAASRGTYGSPRVVEALARRGLPTSRHRAARLMREHGIRGRVRRRFRSTTDSSHSFEVAENLLERRFSADSSDVVWCADLTQVHTRSGPVYLAAIIDIGTRLIVGWSMASHMRTELIERALENALAWRDPAATLMHHSDRGSQYASGYFQALLEHHGITCSMSRKGNCHDNAVIESFFGTFKQEWANWQEWSGLDDARASTHDYVERFYNRERLHSTLGYRTPMEVDGELLHVRTQHEVVA
ncbi:MAG: IS3 family transposase [Planctomycetota bacterium]